MRVSLRRVASQEVELFADAITFGDLGNLCDSLTGHKFERRISTFETEDKAIAATGKPADAPDNVRSRLSDARLSFCFVFQLFALLCNLRKYFLAGGEKFSKRPAYARVPFNARHFPQLRLVTIREYLSKSLKQ